ncbi:MAG: hypothetical protein Q8R28_20890, partial [Dehalococcoidia bacterium]|nr:hypothetical protein [Dehalococcoidia bacterium]
NLHIVQEDFESAVENTVQALIICHELSSPDESLARRDLAKLKQAMGEERFPAALKELGPTGEECLRLLESES